MHCPVAAPQSVFICEGVRNYLGEHHLVKALTPLADVTIVHTNVILIMAATTSAEMAVIYLSMSICRAGSLMVLPLRRSTFTIWPQGPGAHRTVVLFLQNKMWIDLLTTASTENWYTNDRWIRLEPDLDFHWRGCCLKKTTSPRDVNGLTPEASAFTCFVLLLLYIKDSFLLICRHKTRRSSVAPVKWCFKTEEKNNSNINFYWKFSHEKCAQRVILVVELLLKIRSLTD